MTVSEELRPSCCTITGSSLDTLIPAVLQLRLFRPTIYALIDTACLQTNIICTRIAAKLKQDRGQTYDTDIVLTADLNVRSNGVQGIMNLTISYTTENDMDEKQECLRAIVC